MAHDSYADARFYVSTTVQGADLNLAAFQALTYVEVGPVVTLPGLGFERTAVTQLYVFPAIEQTAVGSRKIKSGSLVCGNIPDDPGQVILNALINTSQNRAFRLVRNTTNSAGTVQVETGYTRGVVKSQGDEGGGADDVILATYNMAFNQIPIYTRA
jgi:hypothetical protein